MSNVTRYWRLGLLALAAATAIACGNVPDPDAKPIGQASSGAAAAAQSQAADPPATKYDVPGAKDFALKVKILEKQCFGSAGCNIKYRITLELVTAKTFDPDKTYEISYTVKGLDEPAVGTIEITGTQYRPVEERDSTPSSGSKVVATITEVAEA